MILYRYTRSKDENFTGAVIYRVEYGDTSKIWLYAEESDFNRNRFKAAVDDVAKRFEPIEIPRTTKLRLIEEAVMAENPDAFIWELIVAIRAINARVDAIYKLANDVTAALHIREGYENNQG